MIPSEMSNGRSPSKSSFHALETLKLAYSSSLPEKMKFLETATPEMQIPPSNAFLVRLDGCAFHTFLKGVNKPFDSRITNAMLKTTVDLVRKFKPVSAFTISDEISLVFPPAFTAVSETSEETSKKRKRNGDNNVQQHIFNGRFQKISSVSAAYATARFNYHLTTPQSQWLSNKAEINLDHLQLRMNSHEAHFDARVIPAPDPSVIPLSIISRSNLDGFRNAVSQIATSKYGHKFTHGKSCKTILDKLLDEGIDIFETYPIKNLLGTFVKRVLISNFRNNTIWQVELLTLRLGKLLKWYYEHKSEQGHLIMRCLAKLTS